MKPHHPPISIHDVYQSRDLGCLHRFIISVNATHKPSLISASINRRDSFGRTLLHKLAASHRHPESLVWLEVISKSHHLQINLTDLESGWTPLHRALYHGNLPFAKALIDHFECDLNIKDHEGLLAFELYMLTIGGPPSVVSTIQSSFQPCNSDLFTWGSNRNFLLGIHDDGDRHYPERVHLKRSNQCDSHSPGSIPFVSNGVRFVAMSRLHTALITSEGGLRVCGFGSGGRLGLTSTPKPNNTQDHLNSISAETQFTFAPVKGGGLANQRVKFVALGQDHTVVVTELGQVYTFGMNRFGQLGYAPESSRTSIESMIQVEPKRVAGQLKKVEVIGAAASRWHTAVFSSDSLYTWGANRGQLGYPLPHPHNSSGAIQMTPRKVSIAHTSIIQLSCMNYETAYLCEDSSDVYILKSDITIRVVFPFDRFPSDMQVSILPAKGQSRATRITHISGSDHTLAAVSSMGDVYAVDLEQSNSLKNPINHSISSSPHRSSAPSISSGPFFKPHRAWTSTKWTTAAKSVTVGMDGDLVVVTMSGDVHISYKRSGVVSQVLDIRSSSETSYNSTVRKNYKFQKVPYLQRVSQVAASPTGSYAAIREDIPLDQVSQTSPEENLTLPAMLATMLSHLKKQATLVPELHTVPSVNLPSKASSNDFVRAGQDASYITEKGSDMDEDILDEEEERDALTWDARVGSALVGLSLNWIDHRPSGSLEDGDIFLVACSGEKILVHRFILCCRSKALDQIMNGLITVDGISFSSEQTGETSENESSFSLPMLSFDRHSLLTLLLLIHYLYTDHFPCLWDGRVWPQIEYTHKEFLSTTRKVDETQVSIPVLVNEIKASLKNLATLLSLPVLEKCLERHGKSTPKPSLSNHFRAILPGLGLGLNVTDEVHGNPNHPENVENSPQFSQSHNLNADIELELKDGEVLKCHSILMRSQCPFFRLMYDQGAWVKERRQSAKASGIKSLIRLDMGHLTKKVMQVVLQHIYTDDTDNLFPGKDFNSLNEYIDSVFDVMAVANELMMDKLKFVCSVILRRCVNLLNVTAIASEAEFYRADSLKEICLNHMINNLEGIFQDSKGLSNIPVDLLLSLSNYLKKIQENQSPISRSPQIIEELMRRHSDFLLELDLPTGRSRLTSHHWKSFAKFLAPSSQAPTDADLGKKSLPDRTFARGEIANQSLKNTHSDINASSSSAIVDKIDPIAPGYEVTDDTTPFVMEDVEAEVGSTSKAAGKIKFNGSDRLAWANPIKKVIPLDIRTTIMSTEKLSGPFNLSRDNLGSENLVRLPSVYPTSNQKLSQREKRRQSAEASKSKPESTSSTNQINPTKMPAWRSISTADRKITSGEMDSSQPLLPLIGSGSPPSPPNSMPIRTPNKRDQPQIQAATSTVGSTRVNFAKNSPEPNDPASAVGAAIITPTRVTTKATATRQFSRRTMGGQDTPWTNYASSCSNFIGPTSLCLDPTSTLMGVSTSEDSHPIPLSNHPFTTTVDGVANQSTPKASNFLIIQELQAKESWALYGAGKKMNRPNLIQIQEEENRKVLEKKQEDQFLKWFEEESQRVQKLQQQEQGQGHLNPRSRSNKKSNSDRPAPHRGKKGNPSSKINKEEKRIDHQQPQQQQNPKTPDKSNNLFNTKENIISSNKEEKTNKETNTNQSKNKKKLTSSSTSKTTRNIAPINGNNNNNNNNNTLSNPSNTSQLSNFNPDHYQHSTLSQVRA